MSSMDDSKAARRWRISKSSKGAASIARVSVESHGGSSLQPRVFTCSPAMTFFPLPRTLLGCIVSLGLILTIMCQAQAADPEIEQLRQDINNLRVHYESRIEALEARLAELEDGTSSTASSTQDEPMAVSTPRETGEIIVSSSPVNAQKIGSQFDNQTEVRSQARSAASRVFADRVEEVLQDYIEITGYFRAGYGRNEEGGPQVGFKAPGAFAKPRLGNEPENFGEIVFAKSFFTPGTFEVDDRLLSC